MSVSLSLKDDKTGKIALGTFSADVIGMDTSQSTHAGLIGRNFLANFRFIYDGPTSTFELISVKKLTAGIGPTFVPSAQVKKKKKDKRKNQRKARRASRRRRPTNPFAHSS